ncbi:glutathione S-transferase family protein [Legionella fallonii]|uniref:Putative Glutathione S-transferase n=1 Tax=Legionella fallonii LLAP-10 TaxID=1212491 RepID=A0A098GBL4_9GAMM|nr:glutathione S-transferase family protein [Legionella fallonii]CEG58871.1 putative Glutathione S-transferase [Legionella fallonii LLAP-10]
MIVLYSYPQLFDIPDNNPFGLKVDTFLRLAKLHYKVEHLLNTKDAPRGQLPYLSDGDTVVSESNSIISYLTEKYGIMLDAQITDTQKNLHFLVTRMLDNHLYWVMSYSRWQDDRYWPLFKAEFLRQPLDLSESLLEQFRAFNLEKYHYQGIGRYSQQEVYQAGLDDLTIINTLLGGNDFLFGKTIHVVDACCYGFLANILYFEIDTPLRDFIIKTKTLHDYINRIRALLDY